MAAPSSDRRVRLVVLFGGRSAEHEVSCVTAAHVLAAADPARYAIEAVGITKDGQWVVAEDAVAALTGGQRALPDRLHAKGPVIDPLPAVIPRDDTPVVVLPLLHGPYGEDGTVQGMLELAGVPYVGAGVLGSALCMDKAKSKEVLAHHDLPQVRYRAMHASQVGSEGLDDVVADIGLPLFVKPANLGSSVGVTKVAAGDQIEAAVAAALAYDEWVVIEQGVTAREIECAALGNLDHVDVSVPGEVVPSHDFYDYDDKYLDDGVRLVIPADLPDDVAAEVQRLATRAFLALRAEGMARVDFFYEEGGRGLLVNEVNTIPGFTPGSMYPLLWEASGLSYPALIDALVDLALDRHERRSRFSVER